MSSRTMTQSVPYHEVVDGHIEGARFQIMTLKSVLASDSPSLARAESCVSAAVGQLLQAVSAALYEFNTLLSDPLPAQRLTRKNLRDQFQAVDAESAVLQSVDEAARSGDGWLWSLEQKHDGAAFRHLLTSGDQSAPAAFKLVKDPFDPNSSTEPKGPVEYLDQTVRHVEQLIGQIGGHAHDDVLRYREAQRRQTRRLI